MILLIGLVYLFFVPTTAECQSQPVPILLEFNLYEDSTINSSITYATKEEFRKSTLFRLVSADEPFFLRLIVTTVEPTTGNHKPGVVFFVIGLDQYDVYVDSGWYIHPFSAWREFPLNLVSSTANLLGLD